MPESPLRILELYPKGDFFTGAAIQLRDLAGGLAVSGHGIVHARLDAALLEERGELRAPRRAHHVQMIDVTRARTLARRLER